MSQSIINLTDLRNASRQLIKQQKEIEDKLNDVIDNLVEVVNKKNLWSCIELLITTYTALEPVTIQSEYKHADSHTDYYPFDNHGFVDDLYYENDYIGMYIYVKLHYQFSYDKFKQFIEEIALLVSKAYDIEVGFAKNHTLKSIYCHEYDDIVDFKLNIPELIKEYNDKAEKDNETNQQEGTEEEENDLEGVRTELNRNYESKSYDIDEDIHNDMDEDEEPLIDIDETINGEPVIDVNEELEKPKSVISSIADWIMT